jgi:Flp pilus assembly protein protease CpaA
MASQIVSFVPLAVAVAAAVIDFQTRRVPNVLTLPAMAAGLLVRFPPDPRILWLAVLFFLLWRARVWGGGDAKLWMAMAFWTPSGRGAEAWLVFGIVAVATGMVALAFLIARNLVHRRPALENILGVRRPGAWQTIPYAAWLAMGAPAVGF